MRETDFPLFFKMRVSKKYYKNENLKIYYFYKEIYDCIVMEIAKLE